MSRRVLLVDDEKNIVKGLAFALKQDDYEVEMAYNGEDALEMIKGNEYSLIVLDVMLPKISGFDVCQQVREFSDVPIIMLTAKGDDMDKILGLEYGADDYITKPFNILEVKARVRALIRRSEKTTRKEDTSTVIEKGSLKLDLDGRRTFVKDKEVNLTAKEFDLLELLAKNPNKVYSRVVLLNTIWGKEYPGDERTVDVHVRRLREKIEESPSNPRYVHTKWGVGYYFQS
ncbi:MAG: response regulator transcription factor [Lachnospiraceae bacterium]|nr:response regulator transcription factor [Lachnospiraceae bacterium]MDN4743704.1 response regulator transcription factor [Lachnospiraceae bacterium C1.1]